MEAALLGCSEKVQFLRALEMVPTRIMETLQYLPRNGFRMKILCFYAMHVKWYTYKTTIEKWVIQGVVHQPKNNNVTTKFINMDPER